MILIILIQLADSNFLDLERRIIIRIKLILIVGVVFDFCIILPSHCATYAYGRFDACNLLVINRW